MELSRRHFLSLSCAAFFSTNFSITQSIAKNAELQYCLSDIAIIDWAMLETALAIGTIPLAATELRQYKKMQIQPPIPDSVADIGLRGSPNYELLRILAPKLIIASNFYEYQRPTLEKIAPVWAPIVFGQGLSPRPTLTKATLELGQHLGCFEKVQQFIKNYDAFIQQKRIQFAKLLKRDYFIINLGNGRNFRAFGNDSIFGAAFKDIGLNNAWGSNTSYSAYAHIGIEKLAQKPDAGIIIIGPTEQQTLQALPDNKLWNELPAIKQGNFVFLPPLNHFGALPTAQHFIALLAKHWFEADGEK